MDTQNPSAPPCAQTRSPGKNHPHRRPNSGVSGVIHDNARHNDRFTVIGNHLAQHPELSLLAIGLSVHIQSLPAGARVDIKTLTARFPEGADRIATALRELETHGYLRRSRERTPAGRIVTRTVSCNRPGHHATPTADDASKPPARRATPAQKPPRRALPDVPKPSYPHPTLIQQATDVLSGLRRHDPRLLLSATDAEHLAPGVAAWLERDLTPTAAQEALATHLPPEPLQRPAAFLAHRLAAQLPPPPPLRAPAGPPPVRHPLQNCDNCDRGYRGPEPGCCGECRRLHS
ncbi:helix-turn-helix domain-containing protein [Streptomyces sp. NBC_00576]|uniref:helix-turn-helix domain-containing protein n=1 Tax=Streptomyces sp. NBC_00576 TaxID=2903665 RepID=UPI002E814741|nr:helix-turn-helix domain-containing protein [Streptomyces sp. NBC_00576]WUB72890.1 helix-turn-helix domain-containing protein [Streptomyces sp. NBC_00576]